MSKFGSTSPEWVEAMDAPKGLFIWYGSDNKPYEFADVNSWFAGVMIGMKKAKESQDIADALFRNLLVLANLACSGYMNDAQEMQMMMLRRYSALSPMDDPHPKLFQLRYIDGKKFHFVSSVIYTLSLFVIRRNLTTQEDVAAFTDINETTWAALKESGHEDFVSKIHEASNEKILRLAGITPPV